MIIVTFFLISLVLLVVLYKEFNQKKTNYREIDFNYRPIVGEYYLSKNNRMPLK